MFSIKLLKPIPHIELREEILPPGAAHWGDIVPFASTFNGYQHLGNVAALGEVANKKALDPQSCTLSELRAALFFEYRRYNHFGHDPDAAAMRHIHLLVEEIRKRVQEGEHLRQAET